MSDQYRVLKDIFLDTPYGKFVMQAGQVVELTPDSVQQLAQQYPGHLDREEDAACWERLSDTQLDFHRIGGREEWERMGFRDNPCKVLGL